MKKGLKKLMQSLGYDLVKIDTIDREAHTMFSALKRCLDRGLDIRTVIDVGASDGSWTRKCLKLIPGSDYLLIEAQQPHKVFLEALGREFKNVQFILSAAAGREGRIYFENSDLYGGLASEIPLEGSCIEVDAVTIDEEVERRGLKGPFLIKLDTHGYELPILDGSMRTLGKTELLIIETYNYRVARDSLFFHEMCRHVGEYGFRPIEMADLMLRRRDSSLWQMDIFFIKDDRQEFKCDSYD